MAFKRGRTMRSLLTNLKPKKSPFQKPGVIYRIPCMDCDQAYIGETARTAEERFAEHKRAIRNASEENAKVASLPVLRYGLMLWWANTLLL